MSPAGAFHGSVAFAIGLKIGNHVGERQLGRVFAAETGFILERTPDTVRAPDVAFVRNDRLHLMDERGFFPGAPDLAVEVLSPDDTAAEVMEKVQQWLDAGAAHVWIVNPKNRTMVIYRQGGSVSMHRENDTIAPDDLLPGFRLKVADIFA